MSEKGFYLDLEDMANYLVENTGCSYEQAVLYIDGEEEYLASCKKKP